MNKSGGIPTPDASISTKLKRLFKQTAEDGSEPNVDDGYEAALRVKEELDDARDRLRDPNGMSWLVLRDISKQLIIDHITLGEDVHALLAALSALRDGLATAAVAPIEQEDLWRSALLAARRFNVINPNLFLQTMEHFEQIEERSFYVGRCIKQLRDAGFEVSFVDGFPVNQSELRAVEIELSSRLSAAPNEHLLKLVLHLRGRYNPTTGRYSFSPQLVSGGVAKEQGAWPLGYLFLLISTSLRRDNPPIEKPEDTLARTENTWDLYRAYLGMIDVERWTIFDSMFLDSQRVLRAIRENVLYQQNFAPRQQRPDVTSMIIRLLFSPVEEISKPSTLPFTANEAVSVTEAILSRGTDKEPWFFDSMTISDICGLTQARVSAVLGALAFNNQIADPTQLSVFDLSKADAMYYPLVRLGDDSYGLIDSLIAGPAFYEAIAQAYRPHYLGRFDDILGKIGLESALRTALGSHGLTVYHGKYDSNDDLECDAVVETPGSIILFEAKKKGLTRRSLAGGPESALYDVSGSLLAAHAQLSRHEYHLRSRGEMVFKSGEHLELKGRKIEKIAITLLDLGALQDKVMLGNLLRSLRGATLRVDRDIDDAEAKAISDFERHARVLLEMFVANGAFLGNYDKVENFMIRAYSLSQLLELLRDVNDVEQFERNLAVDRHLTTATGDWFEEYAFAKTLHPNGSD